MSTLSQFLSPTGVFNLSDEASAAQIAALTDSPLVMSTRRLRDLLGAGATPSGSQNWQPDWASFLTADWVMGGNYTLSNPTNVIPGTTRMVRVRGNSTTNRVLSFGTNFVGNLPDEAVDSASYIVMSLYAQTATEIWVGYLRSEDLV